ncbi:DHH family phosphoesterase [Aquibacillus salsiterrae]|uniref:Oligoribonuclease n=1 Tax=Aquibacillus salsiterrae TaxID=2950439 RepID=A0A9X3WCJ6_9BACI|nr:oligoribonuclease [Aquibacillus salsiterrae]MDC3417332.1 oligoribonuclease [Aquibacillus salsiterrae]
MYKLLSHNDLDGVSCGILAKLAFGNNVNVRYNSIASLNREVEYFLANEANDQSLLITDLSVNETNEKRLDDFYQSGGKVQLLDHHKTAISLNHYDWANVTVEDELGQLASATSLLYDYLVTENHLEPTNVIADYVELVRQYDTWDWEKTNNLRAKRLNTLFFLFSIDHFEQKMLNRLIRGDVFEFDAFEQQIVEMEEEKIERYIRRKKREVYQTEVNGFYVGVVYAESYHSELGNQLGKEFPHLDYILIVNPGSKRIGFRTIHDQVDVSQVASHYGGGGHEKASGGTLTEEAYNQFIAKTFPMQPLHEDAKRNKFNIVRNQFGTLYQTREEAILLIRQSDKGWLLEENKRPIKVFKRFEDAEHYIKRKHQAWLAKDEFFVQYLINQINPKQK